MLKNILIATLMVSCSAANDFSVLQRSKALTACTKNGGTGETEPEPCAFGGGLCSYDIADKKSTLCQVDLVEETQNPGFGYDILSVQKKPSCFMTGSQVVKVTPLENTQDDVKVHKSRKERYRESSYSVNVGLNVMEVFSLDIGVAGYNKNHKDTISVSNSATYLYEKESRQLAKAIPTLKPEMKELLLEGKKEEFRRRCGDQFARTVTVGGSLKVVFTARVPTETKVSKTQLSAALKVASAINFGINGNLDSVSEDLRNQIQIDAQCFVRGGGPDVCTKYNLNQKNIPLQDTGWSESLKAAKAELASELKAGKVVALESDMEHYDIPSALGSKDLWEVFVDYKPHRETLRIWSQMNADIISSCETYEHPDSVCEFALQDIKEQINWCARQKHWGTERCQEEGINSPHIAAVIQMARLEVDAGTGTSVKLGVEGRESSDLRPFTSYNLDGSLLKGSDRVYSIKAVTAKGWKLRFYRDKNGGGSSYDFESASPDSPSRVSAPFTPRSFKLVK